MNMTHYMQLLADNQPWNLLLFMVLPVVLAETVAVTELFVLLRRGAAGALLSRLNRAASITGGLYFVGVFFWLMTQAVVPLTRDGGWRGPADMIAVGFYLSGVLPLGAMALIDLGWVGARWTSDQRLARHAVCVAVFLVVAHIAMIFGMLDPTLMWAAPGGQGGMHTGHTMP